MLRAWWERSTWGPLTSYPEGRREVVVEHVRRRTRPTDLADVPAARAYATWRARKDLEIAVTMCIVFVIAGFVLSPRAFTFAVIPPALSLWTSWSSRRYAARLTGE